MRWWAQLGGWGLLYVYRWPGNDRANWQQLARRRARQESCRTPECHCGETRGKIDRGVFPDFYPNWHFSPLLWGRGGHLVGWPSRRGKVQPAGLHLSSDLTSPRGRRSCVSLHSRDDERVDVYGELKVRRAVCVSRARSLEHPQPPRNHKEVTFPALTSSFFFFFF